MNTLRAPWRLAVFAQMRPGGIPPGARRRRCGTPQLWPPKSCILAASRRRLPRGICRVPETGWLGQPEAALVGGLVHQQEGEREFGRHHPGVDELERETVHQPSQDEQQRLQGFDFVLQLHMQPTGKPETVNPTIGLYFADRPPTRPRVTLRVGDRERHPVRHVVAERGHHGVVVRPAPLPEHVAQPVDDRLTPRALGPAGA